MKTRAEQNPPAQIAVFNPVERGRKVRSGWLLLCYWNIIARYVRDVKATNNNFMIIREIPAILLRDF